MAADGQGRTLDGGRQWTDRQEPEHEGPCRPQWRVSVLLGSEQGSDVIGSVLKIAVAPVGRTALESRRQEQGSRWG